MMGALKFSFRSRLGELLPACEHELRRAAAKRQFPTGNGYRHYGAISGAVTPIRAGGGAMRPVFPDQLRDIFRRPDFNDAHGQKLSAAVAVFPDGSIIYFQKGKSLAVENPHGMGISGKWYPAQ
jgi:hypothetical protein